VLASLGRLHEARACHEEALATHRRLGATKEEGVELSYLGVTLHRLGLFSEAQRTHTAALALHRRARNRRLEGADELHLGVVLHELGQLDASRAHFERARAIFREIGDGALLGVTLSYAAALFVERGEPERAGPMLREALACHERAGSRRHEAITWIHIALHHEALGETGAANKALTRALRLGASALEPEHRAWALALRERFDEARAIAIEDPMTARAIELHALASRVRSGAITARAAMRTLERAKPSETSSRIRHAMRALARVSNDRRHGLVVARDGRGFTAAGGDHVSLARRKALSRALVLLTERRIAKPGVGVSWQELLAAAWPGEKVHPEAGFLRVRNALFLLRRLGVGEALLTRDGYLLDPEIDVAWGEI
jgi:tetratricopeptide (TPR) repeat protein